MILNDTDKLVILISFGLGLIIHFFYSKRTSLPLPPGPKKLPLVGNLFDLPTSHEWLKYAEWSKQFSTFPYRDVVRLLARQQQECLVFLINLSLARIDSNIIHVYAVGYDLIILNSFDMALELCDKRSSIYSSRWVLNRFLIFDKSCNIPFSPLFWAKKANISYALRIVSNFLYFKKRPFSSHFHTQTGWDGDG